MLTLKDYQQRALDVLAAYFDECNRIGKADTAFYEITQRNLGQGIPYQAVDKLPGLPYVCLRIPTGGGKTLVACYAVGVAAHDLLHTDHCVALWLVPSNAILEQTVNALQSLAHPYRQALESRLGAVRVMDIQEALYVSRATLDTHTTIIVSTMQAFRVEDTEGRKVYESSGALMNHFSNLPPEALAGLERRADGDALDYSLANVLRLRRPIVIVDEAHNARTSLSFETLARFNPACIIETTATPDIQTNPSNVLHSVSAAELKAEAMIKMPIRLETRPQWKELLADAIARRGQLEAMAKEEQRETGETIRPIMLIQAQPRRKDQDTLTVEIVKHCLLEDHKIPEDQIAIATGVERELEGVDLSSPQCPIRYVITVQALREGWDCPFAYVLCSVTQLHSSTAVEQILGRIMRLPQASWKQHGDLNMAYAFSASASFAEAANALTDALVQNGFNRPEARTLITPATAAQMPIFDAQAVFAETIKLADPDPTRLAYLPAETATKVVKEPGSSAWEFKGVMDDRDREALLQCYPTPEGQSSVLRAYRKSRGLPVEGAPAEGAPAERGVPFSLPVLAIRLGEQLQLFEETYFPDVEWNLDQCGAALTEAEFSSRRPEGQRGEITVSDKGQLEARFLSGLQQQMALLSADAGWSVAQLVNWLDRSIYHPDIAQQEAGIFLTRLVQSLLDSRGLSLDYLVHDKYRLKQAAAARIGDHRQQARFRAYHSLLLPDCPTPLVVTPGVCFTYDLAHYPYSTLYRGVYKFNKHYYAQVGDLQDRGEEFECAQFLDSLAPVKFWVRNLERRPNHSFWLQTSSDKFYPDFVCRLNDERYLVVEYKGEDRWSNDDSKEKRNLGELWAERSGGQCLFVMPKGKDFGAVRKRIEVNDKPTATYSTG